MTKEKIAAELYESAERIGLIPTLYAVFGNNVKVSVPFSRRACGDSMDEFVFSVRASNSMKRAGLFTIGDIIEANNLKLYRHDYLMVLYLFKYEIRSIRRLYTSASFKSVP